MPQPNPTMRDTRFDTLKAVLIALVVFGHIIEPLIKGDAVYRSLYVAIYIFHMPLFVLIAGVFSKTTVSLGDLRKHAGGVLVPLIVFSILYEVFHRVLFGEFSNYAARLYPYWILWFLWSLLIWRIVLPVVVKVKYPVTICVVAGIVAGAFNEIGYFLGLSRTLYFLPFFVLGATLDIGKIKARMDAVPVSAAVAGLIVLLVVVTAALADVAPSILYGARHYGAYDLTIIEGALVRLGLYLAALGASFLVARIVLSARGIEIGAGRNSLYVYVWHGFIIKLLLVSGVFSIVAGWGAVIAIVTFGAMTLLITVILISEPVAHATQRFVLAPVAKLILR